MYFCKQYEMDVSSWLWSANSSYK